eukprot:2248422-Pyramimonas_sp.AAC.1
MRGDLKNNNLRCWPDLEQLPDFSPNRCQGAFRMKIRFFPPASDDRFIVGHKAHVTLREPDGDLQSSKFPERYRLLVSNQRTCNARAQN